jgi:multidrug efflux pump subunit AcrB
MVQYALKNPYAVVVLGLAILVIGIAAMVRLPTDLLPTFKTPAVQILTFYPGMPAEIMEKDITTRLQRWTGQANGIARQEAKSMVGVSVVKDFFREDIDANTAMSQVTSLAMSDLYYLPPGTIPPMVMPFDPTASIPLALISVSSPTFDETKLYDVAYFDLRNRLQSITGVIAPAVYGGKLRRILAYVDHQKAQARGFAPLDVINAIRENNVMIPTGNAKFGALDYQINANGMVATVEALNDLPLNIGNGPPTFVRDVASVEDSAQIQQNVVRVDGKRQVYIPIYRQPGANTIAVVDGIKAFLKPILERVKGVNLDVVMDQSVYVREVIRNLAYEAVLGAGLAAALVLIFLRSYRSMVIVLISLPLACLGAFIGLYFTRETVNAMTLGGLALAIGLLIDQSIVVLENTERHLAMGKSPPDAARDGASEVARPLLIITLTLGVVFFPVVFITGLGKFLFTPLAKTVIMALAASYVLALTLVPVCAARFLRHKGAPMRAEDRAKLLTEESGRHPQASASDPSRFEVEEEKNWFHRLRNRYQNWLRTALGVRWLVLGATVVVFALSLVLFQNLGTELFPQTDVSQFTVKVRAPTGLRIERTEDIIAGVEKAIQSAIPEKERKIIISNIGVLLDWPAAYTPNSGPSDAFILVQLAEQHSKSTFDYVDELREKLPREFPGIEFSFDTGGMMTAALNFGLPSPINIQVEGKDLHVARGIAEKIVHHAQTVPGAADVRIQQRLDAPIINVDVDRVKAAQVGLAQENVVKNIVTALNSSINFAPSFWIDEVTGNHYFIGAQYREEDIKSLETVLDIPITGRKQSTPIPLRHLATFSRGAAPLEVNHVNITRVTDIYINVRERDVGSVAADLEEFIQQIQNDRSAVPEGYRVEMRGEVKSMKESFQSLGFGFVLAIVLVYLVMVVQFRSFLDPFIVMFAVPLGLIGVALMLWLTRTYLSIQSAMGIIMMVGIVVSFSILMVDFANRLLAEARERGQRKTPREAIVEAAGIRLRAILMTGFSAVFGLAPMAIAGGANIPLARAVVGGVLAAVVLVLFVVPVLYLLFKQEQAAPVRI